MSLKNATIDQLFEWHADLMAEIQERMAPHEPEAVRAPWETPIARGRPVHVAEPREYVEPVSRVPRGTPRPSAAQSVADLQARKAAAVHARDEAQARMVAEHPDMFQPQPGDDEPQFSHVSQDEVSEIAMTRVADLERRLMAGDNSALDEWPKHIAVPDLQMLRRFASMKPRPIPKPDVQMASSQTGEIIARRPNGKTT